MSQPMKQIIKKIIKKTPLYYPLRNWVVYPSRMRDRSNCFVMGFMYLHGNSVLRWPAWSLSS